MSQRYVAGFITASYNGFKVPDAPTIGTASSASTTSVSVTFTAPSNVGGAAITSYIATARKISDGTTISTSGSSSPIVITGLTLETSYTVTVTATNTYGTGPSSAASNSVTPFYAIGASYGGGYYAGDISTSGNGVADYRLVVGPKSGAETFGAMGPSNTNYSTYSLINGPSNSSTLAANGVTAASFCEGLTIGGYSDWYMPSLYEFEVVYYNLKPTTNSNNTGFGTNAYSVPARASNYTAGTPPQTSVAAFQSTGGEYLNTSGNPYYWTSTQVTDSGSLGNAYRFGADQGNIPNANITNNGYTRAVRRVAI